MKILSTLVILAVLSASIFGCNASGSRPAEQSETPSETSGAEVDMPTLSGETSPVEADQVPAIMSSPGGEERLVGLSQGTPAPFSGVLLNAAAAAWLESEPDATQERCQLFVTRRLGEIRVTLGADISRLRLHVETLQGIHQIELRNRDAQIQSLIRVNEELRAGPVEWWEQALWVGGALLVGAALGIIFGLVAN